MVDGVGQGTAFLMFFVLVLAIASTMFVFLNDCSTISGINTNCNVTLSNGTRVWPPFKNPHLFLGSTGLANVTGVQLYPEVLTSAPPFQSLEVLYNTSDANLDTLNLQFLDEGAECILLAFENITAVGAIDQHEGFRLDVRRDDPNNGDMQVTVVVGYYDAGFIPGTDLVNEPPRPVTQNCSTPASYAFYCTFSITATNTEPDNIECDSVTKVGGYMNTMQDESQIPQGIQTPGAFKIPPNRIGQVAVSFFRTRFTGSVDERLFVDINTERSFIDTCYQDIEGDLP